MVGFRAVKQIFAGYVLLPYFDFFSFSVFSVFIFGLFSFSFSYSAYFSGAERLLGTDRNQCGNSTLSSKNRYVVISSLYFSGNMLL